MTKQNNLTPIQMTMPTIAHVNVFTQQKVFQLNEVNNINKLLSPSSSSPVTKDQPLNFELFL